MIDQYLGKIHCGEKQSYPTVSIGGKQIRTHRFLMEKHIGRKLRPDELVHHINGNKFDNRINNLKIVTRAEHIKLHDSLYVNSRTAKKYMFTPKQIKEMKRLYIDHTQKQLAGMFGCSPATIALLVGKKPTAYCKCGEKAVMRKLKLCKKCYGKVWYANNR